MTRPSVSNLNHVTKAIIFFITVVSTELGSNMGLYFAMFIWLELDQAIQIEQCILDYIEKRVDK